MPIHLVLAVPYLRSSLDTEGPAGMRGASRGGKEVGTRARKARSRSKQRRQEAQPYDEDMHGRGTRSPAEKEVRDNSPTGGRAPPPGSTRCLFHGNGPARSACPSPAEKNSPRVRQRSESNSKLDGCTAAFLDFEQQKNAPWLPQKGPACGSRRRGRRDGWGELAIGGAARRE